MNAQETSQRKPLVVGLGEVLWDRFPDHTQPGGAPANFAFHAGQLGCNGKIVTRIGIDADGDKLLAELKARGLSTAEIQYDPEKPTGSVLVNLTDGQPAYTILEEVAWDHITWTNELEELAPACNAVCFGTLAQRHSVSRKTIRRFVQATKPDCLRLFDVNLRQSFFDRDTLTFGLEHATALKLNGAELVTLGDIFQWPEGSEIKGLLADFPIQCIAMTLGAGGCEIISRNESWRIPSEKIELADAVGAGDAFAAALVAALLRKRPLNEAAAFANRIGGLVASRPGAMPVLNDETRIAYPERSVAKSNGTDDERSPDDEARSLQQ